MNLEQIEPIEESITVDATPAAVWILVSDLRKMGQWSPECRKVIVWGGQVKQGTWFAGINRRNFVVWPTVCTVHRFDEGRLVGWRVLQNRAQWSYELVSDGLGGTRLVERREMPDGAPPLAALFAQRLLGGVERHEREVRAGMRTTLHRVKAAVEAHPQAA